MLKMMKLIFYLQYSSIVNTEDKANLKVSYKNITNIGIQVSSMHVVGKLSKSHPRNIIIAANSTITNEY